MIKFYVNDEEVTFDQLKKIYDDLDWTINSYESLDVISIEGGEIRFETNYNHCV